MGARGNSGVILSQIVRGAAESLARVGRPRRARCAAPATPPTAPCESRSRGRCSPRSASSPRRPRQAATSPRSIARGDDCVRRTRELLPALDRGRRRRCRRRRARRDPARHRRSARGRAAAAGARESIVRPRPSSRFTSSSRSSGTAPPSSSRATASMPTSSSVSWSRSATRCSSSAIPRRSRFTSTPTTRPRALARRRARDDLERRDREHARPDARARAAACSRRCPIRPTSSAPSSRSPPGAGNRRLFENLGAHVVDGGRTMNPSTAELLAAVEASGAREAILLPNDRNVVLTAEHAAEAAPIPVSVVATTTIQARARGGARVRARPQPARRTSPR